jgi:lysophospholipase L1-like esterase
MGAALFVVALAIVVPGCPQAEPRPTPTPTVMPTVSATPSTTMTPTPTPSPGAVAICTLGDSLTEGDGDDLGRGGYPQRLIEMIQAVRPGSNITNLGRSGWTSDDTVVGGPLEQAIAAQPTIACVLIGSNDLWALYEHGPAAGTGDSEEAEDLSNYTANIDAILRGLGDVGVIVFIGLVDDQSLRPVALNDEMRADVYPNITPDELERMSLQAQRYNEVIRTKAVELGATTVDFYNTTIFTEPATLSEDGNHPNAAGYDAMAQNWFNAIASFLG